MDKPLLSSLGAAVRAARMRTGLTQEDVAERIGMASEVYGRMERGQMLPRVENLRRLCLVLKVPPHELLGLDDLGPGRADSRGDARMRGEESADMRRLQRRLRKLNATQVKLLSLIAGAMVSRGKYAKGRKRAALREED